MLCRLKEKGKEKGKEEKTRERRNKEGKRLNLNIEKEKKMNERKR